MVTGCDQRVELGVPRRGGNVVTVEIGQPMTRCKMKLPEHWKHVGGPTAASSYRWLASGGSPLVLGLCSENCPMKEVSK